ncbi:hypothetical protein V498_02703 [Pseudogymnoascus sp. VKM F-4517 (FW-2822)]|nr:hypothetical protein V498_02703 [Pseudogymnoascus sp. VKM F-4517 (FW-2822)]
MSDGFPTLVPAFTLKANIKGHPATGATSRHPEGISVVDITSGSLISADNYPIKLNAVFLSGSDYIKPDTSGAFLRLDVKSLLKDESGALITLYYTGHIETTEAIMKALSGAPDAKTVEFGNIYLPTIPPPLSYIQSTSPRASYGPSSGRLIKFPATHVTFETGAPELRLLEQRIYVGNGRFIVEDGNLVVEYKISQVQA